MFVVENNKNGRIYINPFEVEKIIYNYVKSNFKNIKCYAVDYDQSIVTVYLTGSTSLKADELDELQIEGKRVLKNILGLYVEKININLMDK